jgi:hypothetical protein
LSGAAVGVIGGGGARRSATTDIAGRFAIGGLFPGTYTVEASKSGYARSKHGQRGLDLPATKVVIRAGAVENVELVLPRAGAVSGIVFDEFGEPVQDASVQIVRVRRSTDGLTVVHGQDRPFVRTDDRGYFRATSLIAGEYVISASVSAHVVIDGVRTAYPSAFWPAGGDLGSAVAVEVRHGEEIGGLALTLRPVPVARLTGVLLTSNGAPAAGTVRLTAAAAFDVGSPVATAQADANGLFSFDDVTFGGYVIAASVSSGPKGPETGRRSVSVSSTDPDAVLIRTSAGSSLEGRFVLDGGSPGDLMWGYSATAVADGIASTPLSVSNLGSPIRDGEPLAMAPLFGPVRLRITSEDDSWYLKSVMIDGFDAADAVFDFGFDGRDYRDVEIVFSKLGATIAGRATDDRAVPVRDYAVYVFSSDRDRWVSGSRSVRVARAAADGSFRIQSLPPGSYWAVAVDRIESAARAGDPADAALLDALIPHATSLVVGEAEVRDVTLRLLRR